MLFLNNGAGSLKNSITGIKMTKKIIAAVLCLLLAVSLCGCSKEELLSTLSVDTDTYDPATEMVADVMNKTVQQTSLTENDFTYTLFTDGTAAVTGYSGKDAQLVIPEKIGDTTVVALENKALYSNESITSLTLPDTLETVGNYACMYCKALESVTFGKGIKNIGVSAFESGCDDTKSEGKGSLKAITFNGSPEIIREKAFYCSDKLTEIILPDGVRTIENWAFAKCYAAKKIIIGEGLESLEDHAFLKCRSVEEIFIPGTCKTIGVSAFYQCRSLKKLTLENGVEELQRGAFEECETLTSAALPQSVKILGKYAFYNCNALSELTATASVETLEVDVFTGDTKLNIKAPAASAIEEYAKANSIGFTAI